MLILMLMLFVMMVTSSGRHCFDPEPRIGEKQVLVLLFGWGARLGRLEDSSRERTMACSKTAQTKRIFYQTLETR